MKLDFEGYIVLYGFVTAILLLYFMKGMSRRRASRLKMKKPIAYVEVPEKPSYEDLFVPDTEGEKALNVIFNYNGHSWDAYEALGVPAGSSADSVHQAYLEALNKVDEKSKHFVEAAYFAVQQSQSSK